MANARRKLSHAEEIALVAQVSRVCPLCGRPLFYRKKSREFKEYEIAHIYPLNPKQEELIELAGVTPLHSDPNHPDNLIALCTPCHTRFDKPRTREEYQELADRKRILVKYAEQQSIRAEYPMERQVRQVLERLQQDDAGEQPGELNYEPKRLTAKFDKTLPFPIRRKIKNAVTDYFSTVQQEFIRIELDTPSSAELIYSQVKAFYVKQKTLGLEQQEIFRNVVAWIEAKAEAQSLESAEIVAAFFVQNCEVFE